MAQLLHVDNISVAFDGFKAINRLSFAIGQLNWAIIGPMGLAKLPLWILSLANQTRFRGCTLGRQGCVFAAPQKPRLPSWEWS